MKILSDVLASIQSHARESCPRECCGILLAERRDARTITDALRAENAERSNPGGRYVLGHRAHIKAVAVECAGRLCIVGYYHSHPHGTAVPSLRDASEMIDGAYYLIMGLRGGTIETALYRPEGSGLTPEPLEVRN
jgi:proteasome lid subunit RPN8/RPN11